MKKVGASDTELAPICVWLPKKTRPFQVSKEVRISMRRLSAKAMETLFIITVDIDVNDSTRLVRFFYGIYLLVIIVPKNEGTSHPSITSTIIQPYILILPPDTATEKHTYTLTTSAVIVPSCPCATVSG